MLRGLIAISLGLLLRAVLIAINGQNALKRFAFPIFGPPLMLTVINLLICGGGKRPQDKRGGS